MHVIMDVYLILGSVVCVINADMCCVSLQGQGAITEKLRSFSMHDLTQISQGDVYPGYSSSNPARRAIMDQPDGAGTSTSIINSLLLIHLHTAAWMIRIQGDFIYLFTSCIDSCSVKFFQMYKMLKLSRKWSQDVNI